MLCFVFRACVCIREIAGIQAKQCFMENEEEVAASLLNTGAPATDGMHFHIDSEEKSKCAV